MSKEVYLISGISEDNMFSVQDVLDSITVYTESEFIEHVQELSKMVGGEEISSVEEAEELLREQEIPFTSTVI